MKGWALFAIAFVVALVGYIVVSQVFVSIPPPDVRPGQEWIVYATAKGAVFLVVFVPLALVSVLWGVFIRRRGTVPGFLTFALVVTIVVAGSLQYGNWYSATRAAGNWELLQSYGELYE